MRSNLLLPHACFVGALQFIAEMGQVAEEFLARTRLVRILGLQMLQLALELSNLSLLDTGCWQQFAEAT